MAAEETKDIEKETVETVEETENEKAPEKEKTAEELLQEEVEALKDKMLRHAAEFDNFKKRTAKEREDIFSMAVCDTVTKILPVKDNLERAIMADDSEGGFKDGVKMILKQLDDALIDLGVEKIKTVGEEFNPEFHNAVMHEENEEFGENTISEELMSGYTCKGKVVRFAMVKVAN
ncbi:MAG: nucleotide exchange factor GrpE [Clostridia bacterium]|nr:nucleotide exchange factor GrpE [Clostridia bacterium]